ncbi:MAG: D-alanine--D-serine ligase VanG [Lachnospiraceae bacterium]|nr:D-alanine--D-serine ligase VanG [Lachnospiraceae bacterium]
MKAEKKRVAILFGGCSSEHEVSLQSAHAVITHLNTEKYEPVLVGITKKGKWLLYKGDTEKILNGTWEEEPGNIPVAASPDRSVGGLWVLDPKGVYTLKLDGAFPVLHGKNGEDGTVQGVFELAGIPVVGCGLLASAICMDKDMAHRLAAEEGVKVPASYLLTKVNKEKAPEYAKELGYPVFVKPLRAGSSFGITKVLRAEELEAAVTEAFCHDSFVLMEEMIEGFEVGCAVMGEDGLTIGAVDEIELSEGFFDFTEKYTLQTSAIHVPARISKEKAEEIKETAATIYRALGCSGFSRVDMFLTPGGDIYFNEVNTIPGFTSHSRFPNMMKEIGISFEEIVDRLVGMTLGV